MRRGVVAVIGCVLFAVGCSSSRETTPVPVTGTSPGPLRVQLTPVASADEPVVLVAEPGSRRLYLAERRGTVRPLTDGQLGEPVLDLTGSTKAEGERGLLGMAFSPTGDWLYVHYTTRDGDTRVEAFPFSDGRADASARREMLTQDQPYANHNGGGLITGPDGRLYLALGDGGAQGDPQGNGQKLGTWLGKVLRIEPTPSATEPYLVPTDNPFVGTPGARPEIWVYGLRNPWRFSFDRTTGDLWVGDVGGSEREEIDWRPAGQAAGSNFGWSAFEGTRPFRGTATGEVVAPVYEYTHDEGGCSVTGGYVYRGERIPALRGLYLFSDYCTGRIRALLRAGDRAAPVPEVDLEAAAVVGFGEDAAGELYVLSLNGPVYRIDPA